MARRSSASPSRNGASTRDARENDSSAEDIPSRSQLKKAAEKQLQKETENAGDADDDDDEDMEPDEYVVEKVLRHKFDKSGLLLLQVKWQGYDLKDATWEPEENLDGCPDELEAYYREVGGKPEYRKPIPKEDKKRKLSHSNPDTPPPAPDRLGKGRKKTKIGAAKDSTVEWWKLLDSWEDHVNNIDTMEKGDNGRLYAYVVWKDGTRTRIDSESVNKKCPQKMLQFYEAHLYVPPR